jgi:penicillin-binding protein 1C
MTRWLRRGAAGLLLAASALLLLDRLFPPDLSRLAMTGREIVDRSGRTVAVLPAPGGVWRFRIAADDVSPVLVDTLIATEDRRFWWHPGVDPVGLLRAVAQDVRAGHVVSGGSTLTMQAARLLHPRPRTVTAKLIEMARAMQLEAHFSKREILGIWLTLAPYGGNLEGVQAAALAWFGVSPHYLDAAQSALLVAIPRRPEALRPDRHPTPARALRDRILRADGGPVPNARIALPRHAAQALAALPATGRVTTTLDLPLQVALERLAAERATSLPDHAALALLVADVNGDIAALATGGPFAMDLTRASRSPGSALKPFIYAMAYQDGLIGPETRVDDLPRRFGAYAPENFDRAFAGPVTAGEALRRSLNLPAVALLDRVGPLRFATVLRQAGAVLRLPPGGDPSLPLALGGVGITLRDIVGLYAGLATDGDARRLRLLPTEPAPNPAMLQPRPGAMLQPRPGAMLQPRAAVMLQPRAAAMVAGILTQPFPDWGQPGVAWKTGTSWGGRDAWAIGFDQRHVVGAWVGRPDGTPLQDATGRALALPLLARVFDLLPGAPRPITPPVTPAGGITHDADALRLLFPPPGATLSGDGSVTLRAMGGQRPLTFLVDGAPLPTDPARRDTNWLPPAPGFYKLTVLDAAGGNAQAAVRIK